MSVGFVVAPAAQAGTSPDVRPFRGLGTWIDVYDYVPSFLEQPGPTPVTPETVDDMAALGVDTLYLQAAINDDRAHGLIVDRDLVGELLNRAHRHGLDVVAWYYPTFADPARDLLHLRALATFRARGERFDGIALDIESREIADVAERNRAVVTLAKGLREAVGDGRPLGAIVYPAVQLEVVYPPLWPGFPYRKLAKSVDVWMPMTYWTYRDGDYRDAFRYTEESVRRLRNDLDDKRAVVHPIGGLGELSTPGDYERFARAVKRTKAVGWSVYDLNTTATTAWARLRSAGSG